MEILVFIVVVTLAAIAWINGMVEGTKIDKALEEHERKMRELGLKK